MKKILIGIGFVLALVATVVVLKIVVGVLQAISADGAWIAGVSIFGTILLIVLAHLSMAVLYPDPPDGESKES